MRTGHDLMGLSAGSPSFLPTTVTTLVSFTFTFVQTPGAGHLEHAGWYFTPKCTASWTRISTEIARLPPLLLGLFLGLGPVQVGGEGAPESVDRCNMRTDG